MTKIAIIGCYYGKFPAWMQYWLKSCASNPTIDFLVVTDSKLEDTPKNVRTINMTLSEIKNMAEKKLEISEDL